MINRQRERNNRMKKRQRERKRARIRGNSFFFQFCVYLTPTHPLGRLLKREAGTETVAEEI